jgi:hypothetical protein
LKNLNKNEFYPMDEDKGATPVESLTPSPYKDRSTGLTIFGIFTLLLGCLCGLFIPLMLVGRLAAPAGSPQTSLSAILPATFIYGALAVALIWLGIGSMMARRWARALLVIFSWSSLGTGVLVLIFLVFLLPKTLGDIANNTSGNNAMPPGALVAMMVTMTIIFGGIFILVPGVWAFFYTSRNVKATCEARDPVMRWTDACPLPVLGISIWLAFSGPMLLISQIVGRGVTPFFGIFLTGVVGGLFCFFVAFVWVYSAWLLYKLKPLGWWMIFVAICLLMISTFITFSRHDALEMYRLMDYPQSQIDQIEKTGLLAGNQFIWICAIWMLPLLGYLWFVRRYIFRKIETVPSLGA